MKTRLLLIFGILLCLSAAGQQLNDKGLYVDNDGSLFTGIINTNENGTRQQIAIREGIKEGEASYYYANNKLMERGNFSNGLKDGKWQRFDENGGISAIAFYQAGKKTGTWLVYDDRGQKRFEMNYADGKKTGTWTRWNEKGEVIESKDYGQLN